MPVVCQCPSCKAKYELGDQYAGRKIKCPKCGAAVTVPVAAAKPPLPVATAVSSPSSADKASSLSSNSAPAAVTTRVVKAEPLPAKPLPRVKESSEELAAVDQKTAVEQEIQPGGDDGLDFLGQPALGHRPAKGGPSPLKAATPHVRKKYRKSAPPWMLAAIGGGVLAAIALVGAAFYFSQTKPDSAVIGSGKKPARPQVNPNVPLLTFNFDWLENERRDATLTVNGEPKDVPVSGAVEYKLPAGEKYSFVLAQGLQTDRVFAPPDTGRLLCGQGLGIGQAARRGRLDPGLR